MLKAQRPVQSVRMKMGPRLASYHGFRKVWGHREAGHTFLTPPRAAKGVPSPVETQLKPLLSSMPPNPSLTCSNPGTPRGPGL